MIKGLNLYLILCCLGWCVTGDGCTKIDIHIAVVVCCVFSDEISGWGLNWPHIDTVFQWMKWHQFVRTSYTPLSYTHFWCWTGFPHRLFESEQSFWQEYKHFTRLTVLLPVLPFITWIQLNVLCFVESDTKVLRYQMTIATITCFLFLVLWLLLWLVAQICVYICAFASSHAVVKGIHLRSFFHTFLSTSHLCICVSVCMCVCMWFCEWVTSCTGFSGRWIPSLESSIFFFGVFFFSRWWRVKLFLYFDF